MQAESLFNWSEPTTELVGILAAFLADGAIGFRYAALRGGVIAPMSGSGGATAADVLRAHAARRAAIMGLVGTLVSAAMFARRLPALAARRHVEVAQLVTGDVQTAVQVVMLLAAAVGFALAASRRPAGWPIAAIGVVVGTLRGALVGQWSRLVNPMHSLAAGLWIGTLFVLVVAGIATVMRDERSRERRGVLVADMVNGFSPLALASGAVVVIFGLITAWRHLHTLSNLWSTPYGWALIVKLCFVALVFALGAWNWRRQRPTLGSEGAAVSIRRSAATELAFAGAVLVATAILLSIPAPRPPGAPGATGARAAGEPTRTAPPGGADGAPAAAAPVPAGP